MCIRKEKKRKHIAPELVHESICILYLGAYRLAKVITGNSLQAGHSTVEDEDVKKEANSVMSGRRCKGGVVLNGLTKVRDCVLETPLHNGHVIIS